MSEEKGIYGIDKPEGAVGPHRHGHIEHDPFCTGCEFPTLEEAIAEVAKGQDAHLANLRTLDELLPPGSLDRIERDAYVEHNAHVAEPMRSIINGLFPS